MIEQFTIKFSTKVKKYLFDSTLVFGNGLKDKSYVKQDLYLTTFILVIKSILVTLFNCNKTIPDIRIYLTVSKSNFLIFIHLRITQGVKTHATLKRKCKFLSQPQTPCCRVNLVDIRQVRRQPIVAPLQKSQRASISTRAPKAVVPQQPTRCVKAHETIKPAAKLADEFSKLRSKRIK